MKSEWEDKCQRVLWSYEEVCDLRMEKVNKEKMREIKRMKMDYGDGDDT